MSIYFSDLDMTKYMAEEDPGCLYDLFALCNHSGRMASGHCKLAHIHATLSCKPFITLLTVVLCT